MESRGKYEGGDEVLEAAKVEKYAAKQKVYGSYLEKYLIRIC